MRLSVFFALFAVGAALAQQPARTIVGTVVDASTKEPVSFASIVLTNTARGTAADEKGQFLLQLREGDEQRMLIVSAIGYRSSQVSAGSANAPVTILLTPVAVELSAVEVAASKIDPASLVRAAIDSIPANYPKEPFNLHFYSTIVATSPAATEPYKIESHIVGYYPGYISSGSKRFEIVRKRSHGTNPLSSDYPFWPTFELHNGDLLSHPETKGVLERKFVEHFELQYHGVLRFDEDTVYHVSYVLPKPNKKITGYGVVPKVYRGELYITVASHAIVKHVIDNDHFRYSIIYRKTDEHYLPYFLSGERRATGSANPLARITNTITLQEAEFIHVNTLEFARNEFQNLSSIPDDETFNINLFSNER